MFSSKSSIFIIFLLSLLPLRAQVGETGIEDEIMSYVDSTELLVNNGKLLLIDYIQIKDYEKVAEVYYYLNDITSSHYCSGLTYSESLLIASIIWDWNTLLTKIRNYKTETEIALCNYGQVYIYNYLSQEFTNDVETLKQSVEQSELTREEKDLLDLYFYAIANRQDYVFEKKRNEFKKKYPNSIYGDFVNIYLKPSSKYAMTFGFGAAGIFPVGKLGSYFFPKTVFAMQFDVYLNKFYFGFQLDVGNNMTLQKDMLQATTGYSQDIYKNHNFSYMDVGLYFGYLVFQNQWLQLSPYIYLGGLVLESNFDKRGTNNDEFKVYNSFFLGPGFRADFNPFKFGRKFSSINLRIDVGFNYPVTVKYQPARGSILYANMALVWRIGNF